MADESSSSSTSSESRSSSSSSSSTSQSFSSSTSSIDSKSSSTSSSSSSEAYSSHSSSSSSSTNSIDSSSSSEESAGNISSSSSSSAEYWSEIKPVWRGRSLVSYSRSNRLCQSFYCLYEKYNIGLVYCYFYGPFGSLSGNITISLYEGNSIGEPTVLIKSASIMASTIENDGWYSFEINTSGSTPNSKYLCFVLHADNMTEQNYAIIGHYEYSGLDKSFYNESGNWIEQQHGWAIIVNQNESLFDLNNFRINAINSPTIEEDFKEYSQEIIGNSINYTDDTIKIKYSDLIASFVVDNSGSMGNIDRENKKTQLLKTIAEKFNQKYPGKVYYDIINFGGVITDVARLVNDTSSIATINLNLSTPTRTTYTFTTNSDINVADGDIYTNGDATFEIIGGGSYLRTFHAIGNMMPESLSGTLIKTNGLGTSSIEFSFYKQASVEDGIIAWGIKNAENGHTYNIGEIKVGDEIISGPDLRNINLFNYISVNPTIEIGVNGPNEKESLDLSYYNSTIFRKNITNSVLLTELNFDEVKQGDSTTIAVSAINLSEGKVYDIIDGDVASTNMKIKTISSNNISFYEKSSVAIKNHTWKSIIQETALFEPRKFDNSTAKLLIRDENATRNITFFMQTVNGLPIEWDFKPFKEWIFSNLFWIGEAATLNYNLYDENGNPFPDGTRIDIYVDTTADLTSIEIKDKILTKNAYANEDIIYVDNIDGLKIGQTYDITNSLGDRQSLTIKDYGESTGEYFVKINETLAKDYLTTTASKIIYKLAQSFQLDGIASSQDNKINFSPCIQNITQIIAGSNYPANTLSEYDKPAPSYTNTYESIISNKTYFASMPASIPTIDGKSAIRILPITEDSYKTIKQQNEDIKRLTKQASEDIFPSQPIRNTNEIAIQNNATEIVEEKDYAIETPVFSIDGEASSKMTSYAKEFEQVDISGFYIQGVNDSNGEKSIVKIFGKKYKLQSTISLLNDDGALIAKQILKPQDTIFVSPYNIFSNGDGQTTYYMGLNNEEIERGNNEDSYIISTPPGVYASGNEYKITYTVTNKFNLINDGYLSVKIYTNRNVDLDGFSANLAEAYSTQFLNVKNSNSKIDIWRSEVKNKDFLLAEKSSNKDVEKYSNSLGWSYAKQYSQYEFLLPIKNGLATLTIPMSNIVSLLMVEASYDFENNSNYEAIRADYIFISNPITVGIFNPESVTPLIGTETFETGLTIKWMNNSLIDDGTIVEIGETKSKFIPTISQTTNGLADGLTIGPHKPIIFKTEDGNDTSNEKPDIEIVPVFVSHKSGYSLKTYRLFSWMPQVIDTSKRETRYVMSASKIGSQSWSDGSLNNQKIQIDIYDNTNEYVYLSDSRGIAALWVGPYSASYMNGLGQPGDLPALVTTKSSYLKQKQLRFINGKVQFEANNINENTGYHTKSIKARISSSYYDFDDDGIKTLISRVASTDTDIERFSITDPTIDVNDPLQINMYVESRDGLMLRDNITTVDVVADVSWKGQRISRNVIIDEGTTNERTITYDLPYVIFESGICEESNKLETENENPTPWELAKDKRGPYYSCLRVSSHKDIQIDRNNVQVGYLRTNIHDDLLDNKHVHECVLSEDGTGTTTRMIVLSGNVSYHYHEINQFVVATEAGHDHSVRSVAITTIAPTLNGDITMTIRGTTTYDPTDCIPYGDESKIPYRNRKSFNSVDVLGKKTYKKKLVLDLETSPSFKDNIYINKDSIPVYFTAKTILESNKGFDIRGHLYYTQYTDYTNPNNPVLIPQENISNGTRINFETTCYACPKESFLEDGNSLNATNDVHIVSYDKRKLNMILHIKAFACVNGDYVEKTTRVIIASDLQWLPLTTATFSSPTNEYAIFNSELVKSSTIGSTQIYDAIYKAISRIIDNLQNEQKAVIFIVSDGEENNSTVGIDKIKNTFAIHKDKISFAMIKLKTNDNFGKIIGKNLSDNLHGVYYQLPKNEDLGEATNKIITNRNFNLNNSEYKNDLAIPASRIINSFSINSVEIPYGTQAHYSYRSFYDNSYSLWADDKEVDKISKIANEIEDISYIIKLHGNSEFQSPEVNKYISSIGNDKKETFVFFKPVYANLKYDEYVSSILATYAGNVDKANISFGFAITNSEFDNAEKINFTWIDLNKKISIPNRYAENVEYYVGDTYKLQYGAWNDEQLRIFKFNENNTIDFELNTNSFEFSNINGTISIKSDALNEGDYYIAQLERGRILNFVIKITNGSEEYKYIDHINIVYNTSKRYIDSKNRNTINTSLKKRIK